MDRDRCGCSNISLVVLCYPVLSDAASLYNNDPDECHLDTRSHLLALRSHFAYTGDVDCPNLLVRGMSRTRDGL